MNKMFKFLTPYKRESHVKHSKEFFAMAIVGRSNCGKTHYLLELLKGELFKKFNCIMLICPTFAKNQTYLDFCFDDRIFVIPNEAEKLNESIDLVRSEATKYYRSLVILDDLAGHNVLNSRTSKYVNLLMNGRHDGLSSITITQQLTSISKPARDQMTRIVSFYNADSDDRKIMFGKYLVDITKEERQKIIHHLRMVDYSKIDINILKGTYKLI